MNKDLVGGFVLLALAGAYYWSATTIPQSMLDDAFGARGLPVILAGLLAFLAVILIAQSLLNMRAARASAVHDPAGTTDGDEGEYGAGLPRALGFLLIGVGYVLLLPVLGYPISIGLMIATIALFEGAERNWKIPATAVFGGVLFWLLFDKLLGVAQPSGILF